MKGTQVLSANDSLKNYMGGEKFCRYGQTKIIYTMGVQEITEKSQSNWFLDIIYSYQSALRKEEFQVWKLEREYSFTTENGIKTVLARKDVFNVVCEDGNDNVLIKQRIEFSDFPFDEFTVWFQNETIYLPCEH